MNKRTVHHFNEVCKFNLISLAEVSVRLTLSIRTIYRLSGRGKLPPIIKIGRSSRMDWDKVIEFITRQGGLSA